MADTSIGTSGALRPASVPIHWVAPESQGQPRPWRGIPMFDPAAFVVALSATR